MATVNFSVPEEVKEAFQEAFANENKSAVIARLMQQAVEEKRREHRRAAAIDALLELRRKRRPVSDAEIAGARKVGRACRLGQIVQLADWQRAAPSPAGRS